MEVKCNKDQNISGIYRPVTVNVILQLPQIESILFKGLIIWQERRLINTILKKPLSVSLLSSYWGYFCTQMLQEHFSRRHCGRQQYNTHLFTLSPLKIVECLEEEKYITTKKNSSQLTQVTDNFVDCSVFTSEGSHCVWSLLLKSTLQSWQCDIHMGQNLSSWRVKKLLALETPLGTEA